MEQVTIKTIRQPSQSYPEYFLITKVKMLFLRNIVNTILLTVSDNQFQNYPALPEISQIFYLSIEKIVFEEKKTSQRNLGFNW